MREPMDFGMPLDEAMQTQRAIRRLKTDPVDDETVLRLIDLALKAPTGSNTQGREFIIVKDQAVKDGLARLNRQPWRLYSLVSGRVSRRKPRDPKIVNAVLWQADHFEEVPVVVIACLKGRPIPFLHVSAVTYYGSIFPAAQKTCSWQPALLTWAPA